VGLGHGLVFFGRTLAVDAEKSFIDFERV